MSAFGGKADIANSPLHVRLRPKPDISTRVLSSKSRFATGRADQLLRSPEKATNMPISTRDIEPIVGGGG
jgi:hypothetical protein